MDIPAFWIKSGYNEHWYYSVFFFTGLYCLYLSNVKYTKVGTVTGTQVWCQVSNLNMSQRNERIKGGF